uniref:Uncharacterized protein n=1 Tax=Arundo donax TaxID=35708 RepID=A0A0A9FBL3_ARUDO
MEPNIRTMSKGHLPPKLVHSGSFFLCVNHENIRWKPHTWLNSDNPSRNHVLQILKTLQKLILYNHVKF